MKLTGYKLRRLVESVLYEADEPKEQDDVHVLTTTTETASDNKKAIEVKKDGDLKALLKALGTKYSGPYYVWADSDAPGAHTGKGIKNVGGFYSPGAGDPYTYEKISGDKYRVISGPLNKGKYKSGKPIGARPIGATFTMSKAPKPIPPPDVKAIPDWQIVKETVDAFKATDAIANSESSPGEGRQSIANDFRTTYLEALHALIKNGDSKKVEEMKASIMGSEDDTGTMGVGWKNMLVASQVPNGRKDIAELWNKVDDLMNQALAIDFDKDEAPFAKHGRIELKSVKGQASSKNEGLSRGSLYRRRYYGRY